MARQWIYRSLVCDADREKSSDVIVRSELAAGLGMVLRPMGIADCRFVINYQLHQNTKGSAKVSNGHAIRMYRSNLRKAHQFIVQAFCNANQDFSTTDMCESQPRSL
jgi:hypothetical protein